MIQGLTAATVDERLDAVRALGEGCREGVVATEEVNNHVHSIYSFSPYTPSAIAVKAAEAGLETVGIMDHDSVSGCQEFLEACKAVNIAGTVGVELRVNMNGTAVEGRKTNNPDEPNVSYIALHGIPVTQLEEVDRFLRPIRSERQLRGKREVEALNRWLAEREIEPLDFERDVLAVSEAANGGTVTERHILYALSLRLIDRLGKGPQLLPVLQERFGLSIGEAQRELLTDADNPHYAYDLLGVFKSALVPHFFIPSSQQECVSVHDVIKLAETVGAIPAYAYLGDVGESPTGDKRAEQFEDSYLDELMQSLVEIGFRAITYMPPRNSRAQLQRLQALCRTHGLMEISGVDINSSRQSFNCPILLDPEFVHLRDSAWALVAHEKLAAMEPAQALFHPNNPLKEQSLTERIAHYAEIGRSMDQTRPERVMEWI